MIFKKMVPRVQKKIAERATENIKAETVESLEYEHRGILLKQSCFLKLLDYHDSNLKEIFKKVSFCFSRSGTKLSIEILKEGFER